MTYKRKIKCEKHNVKFVAYSERDLQAWVWNHACHHNECARDEPGKLRRGHPVTIYRGESNKTKQEENAMRPNAWTD